MRLASLPILVFIVTATVTKFASSLNNKKTNHNTIILDWHEYNYAGDTEKFPVVSFVGTEEEAQLAFGCIDVGPKICARAYDLNNIPTDYYLTKY